MKILDILKFMGELGWRYKRSEIEDIELYFSRMIADGRVLTIYDNSILQGILIYSICKDTVPFIKKHDWSYLKQDTDGTNIFIEHIAVKKFDREMFKKLYQLIDERYPHLERCIWKRYRQPTDKVFTMKRRSIYELQDQYFG